MNPKQTGNVRTLAVATVALLALMAPIGALSPAASAGASARAVRPLTGSTNLTIASAPGANPSSVFPFNDAAQCSSTNIDYWKLMYLPGYRFGLGNNISVQYSLSPLTQPTFTTTGGDTVATISTKGWNWTTGSGGTERLNAQDVVFWLNMDRAQKSQGSHAACSDAPGLGLPDQVKGVTTPGGLTGNKVQITFAGKENTSWLINNELSQIDPMPIAWDTTGGAPGSGGCSSQSFTAVATDGSDACSTVFDYLSGLQINNAIWDWADGPYRQQSAGYSGGSPDGNNVLAANTSYSGPVAAHAVKTITFVPYTTESAEQAALQAGRIDIGYLEPNEVGRSPGPGKAGAILPGLHLQNYTTDGSVRWGVNYWLFNYDNSNSTYHTSGPLPLWADELNNLYFREAMQEAIDQPGIVSHVLNGYGIDTFSAIPTYPKNAFAKGVTNPYTHNASKAKALMKANGWIGDTCARSGVAGCGSAAFPIPKGATSAIQLLYPSGDTTTTEQVNAEVAMIKTAGIDVTAKAEPATTVQSVCLSGAAEWQVCDLQGRIYAPNIYPSGEALFATGSSSNSGGYSNPEMNKLVAATVTSGGIGLNQNNPAYHTSYAQYTASALPVLWQPTTTGFEVVLKSIKGLEPPNPLGEIDPEYITSIGAEITESQWQKAMQQLPVPGAGCFTGSYPFVAWNSVVCHTAPDVPFLAKHFRTVHRAGKIRADAARTMSTAQGPVPFQVGNGIDYSAQVTGLMTGATGSFSGDTAGVTETGLQGGLGLPTSNAYSLQLNSQFFNTPVCVGGSCLGWEQFIFTTDPSPGQVLIQYWLLNYAAACPLGWITAGAGFCFMNSPASNLTGGIPAANALNSVQFSGSATTNYVSGVDSVVMTTGSGNATASGNSSVLQLGSAWNTAEFGIFGDGGATGATFNPGTTLNVQTTVHNGTTLAPTCVYEGFTGETNNLNLTATPVLSQGPSPAMVDTQTYAGGAPACATATGVGDTHEFTFPYGESSYNNRGPATYSFQGTGDFVDVTTGTIKVEARQKSQAAWPGMAVNNAVAALVGGNDVAVCSGPTRLEVNDSSVSLPVGVQDNLSNGANVTETSTAPPTFLIRDASGDSLQAQVLVGTTSNGTTNYINEFVGLGRWSNSGVHGLLANATNDLNALETSAGGLLTSPISFSSFYKKYGSSWYVPEGKSLLSACGPTARYGMPKSLLSPTTLTVAQRNAAGAVCTHVGLNNSKTEAALFGDCQVDVTVLGKKGVANVYRILPKKMTAVVIKAP